MKKRGDFKPQLFQETPLYCTEPMARENISDIRTKDQEASICELATGSEPIMGKH